MPALRSLPKLDLEWMGHSCLDRWRMGVDALLDRQTRPHKDAKNSCLRGMVAIPLCVARRRGSGLLSRALDGLACCFERIDKRFLGELFNDRLNRPPEPK